MATNDDEMPELPDHGPATGATIDRRLDQTDEDLDTIRAGLDRLNASLDASMAGDHERAAEIMDDVDDVLAELKGDDSDDKSA